MSARKCELYEAAGSSPLNLRRFGKLNRREQRTLCFWPFAIQKGGYMLELALSNVGLPGFPQPLSHLR
jgi:hypothetical protein